MHSSKIVGFPVVVVPMLTRHYMMPRRNRRPTRNPARCERGSMNGNR